MREEPALLSGSAAESPDQVFRPPLEMLKRESRQQRRQILERFTKLGRADINGCDAAADNGRRKATAGDFNFWKLRHESSSCKETRMPAILCRPLLHAASALSLRELARIEMLQSIKQGWEHNGSVHLIWEILSAHLHALRLKFANKV